MSIYDDLAPVVSEVLGEFAQGTVQLIQITAGNGAIDDPGAPTETTTTLDAVVRGVTFNFIKQGLAVASDFLVTAKPVSGITITEKDFVTIDGTRYKIVQDVSVPAAGTKLVWNLIVRKGA